MAANSSNPDDQKSNVSDNAQNPFAAGLGASLGFFQDWMKAAGSAVPGMQGAAASSSSGMGGMSGLGSWTMPTLDPEELEKRIKDLKTVQFWLEQNARMVAMTIQGLEVQRMTLSTLKGMNVSMDALRDSLKARTHEAEAPPPQAAPESSSGSDQATGQGINPMQWWDTLTQQFTTLASQAAQASADVSSAATNTMAQAAASATAAAASAADAVSAAAQASPAAKKARGAAAHPPKPKPSSGTGHAD